MGTQNTFAEVAAVLQRAQRVLVVSHYNPDPDAYGSACGLALALRDQGKTVALLNESGIIPRLNWIPGVAGVVSEIPPGSWDVAAICDCGDAKRIGDKIKDVVLKFPCVVNLDHHLSNDFFGHFNIVLPEACSTSEIIADLIVAMGAPLSPQSATCLFAGLSGDTGSFKYSSTTAKAFALAMRLVDAGAVPAMIAHELYGRSSLASLRLQGESLQGLKLHADARIAWLKVTNSMLKSTGAEREDADHLVDVARDIEGVIISVLLKEDYGFWRVSLRTKAASVDLSAVAGSFGGGGHKAASGFRWRRPIAELEPLLLAALVQQLQ